MEIAFASKKLAKQCNDAKERLRTFGAVRAKKLGLRLDDLAAAQVLDDVRKVGVGSPHELKNDRKGQIAVSLDGPFRLIFVPSDDPPATRPDGGIDWTAVRSVRILEVTDYHGD